MQNINEIRLKVALGKQVPYWWRFAYLHPNVFDKYNESLEEFAKIIQGNGTAFNHFVQTHVQAYIEKGTLPPESITAPIINIAEDVLAGREPIIRAGDYIAIQKAMRK